MSGRAMDQAATATLRNGVDLEPDGRPFQSAPVALYRTAADGTLLDANDALVALLGYPDRDTLMRVNAGDVYFDPHDRRRWQDLLERQGTARFEMRDRRHDGSIIWVRDVATAVRDAGGRVICYEGMLDDVTSARATEKPRSDGDEHRPFVGLPGERIEWAWNRATGEVTASHALEEAFGFDARSVGAGIERWYAWWLGRIHPEDRARVSRTMHRRVSGGDGSWWARYRIRRMSGAYASVLDRGIIERDDAGLAVRVTGILVDLDSLSELDSDPEAELLRDPPVPGTADATLVRWMREGRPEALDELYRRHAAHVLIVAAQASSSLADAEEVVTEVFMKAWDRADAYDSARGDVTAWLSTIARSRALDRIRKACRRSELLRAELYRAASDGAQSLLGHSAHVEPTDVGQRVIVEESLADLPERHREVIDLAYFAGLSHSEIAEQLGEPLGTVKSRIRAGLSRIRRRLNGDG